MARAGESIIKGWLEDNFESCTIRKVNETIGHIQRQTSCSRGEFDNDPLILNLKNGILTLRTFEFQWHSADRLSLVQLPVKYDAAATCPAILKFLSEVPYPEDLLIVQEYVGYCLWKDYPNAKVLLLVGDGENGKSTLIALVESLLGRKNISSRGLQELEMNRFAKADLYGKLANLYADLPDTALGSTGTFKMLTGGDPITAEHKFTASFNFTNYSKLIFSANKVPEAFEDTTGFFRRWAIVTFPNSFSGDKADKNLLQRLTTEAHYRGGAVGFPELGDRRVEASDSQRVELFELQEHGPGSGGVHPQELADSGFPHGLLLSQKRWIHWQEGDLCSFPRILSSSEASRCDRPDVLSQTPYVC